MKDYIMPVLVIVMGIGMVVASAILSGKVTPFQYEQTVIKCPHCHTEFKLKDSERK